MARTFAEETVETSNTTGTGSYTLDGAKGDYLPFEATYGSGDKPAYVVRNKNNTKWEMNRGAAFTPGSPATLARNVWKSTNSNAAVPWTVDDLPLTVYVPASAEVHEGVVTGWLAAARHALLRAGALFWTYADAAVRWDRYLALGDSTATHIGHVDVPSGLYFGDGRRPWTAVGAANKIVAAADIGGVFTQDNSAADRVFTLPAHGDAGVGHGFRVGGLGLTAGGQYGIVLTPAAGDGIDGGADGVVKRIPGGVRFDVEWDEAGDTWRVSWLNTMPAVWSGRRQTIAAGPVSTAGLPIFLPSTNGALSLTAQNITAVSRFVATAANGWDWQGRPNDRVGVSLTNLAWTGLTASRAAATPNFLYVAIGTDGTLTPGSTLLAPIYQHGGTPDTTSGQFTFNIAEMKGYLGNGSTAPEAFVVFVGEAATDGSGVISTVAYAYNSRFESTFTATLPGASTAIGATHNLGVKPRLFKLVIENTTTELGYAVGEQVTEGIMGQLSTTQVVTLTPWSSNKSGGIVTGNGGSGSLYVASRSVPGAWSALTLASWKYGFIADRGW
ncbi:MAG: hypothetical protein FD144_4758 [Rhodospirillaceae bacterium]|nr:MAG: hypothetical protein FD144_4758 [Rhodospirillaceae bacterium]